MLSDWQKAVIGVVGALGMFLAGIVVDARKYDGWLDLQHHSFEFVFDCLWHFANACIAFASGFVAHRGSSARQLVKSQSKRGTVV